MRRDRSALWRWGGAAAALAIALLPWSLVSWLSSGTPFFPIFDGNYRFPAGFLSYSPRLQRRLLLIAAHVWYSRVWLLLLLALVLLPVQRLRGIIVAICVAAFGTILITAVMMSVVLPYDVFRYTAPLVLPGLLFLAGSWLACAASAGGTLDRRRRARAAALAAATVAWLIQPLPFPIVRPWGESQMMELGPSHVEQSWKNFQGWLGGMRAGARKGWHEPTPPGALQFGIVQERLGPEARLVSAVAKPFHWRFDLQVVHTIDCLGQASPPPGMPFFAGPQPVADYFLDLGYTHLAFTPPTASPISPTGNCLYSRRRWKEQAQSQHPMFAAWAPYFLDFLRNEEILQETLGTVYSSPDLVLVDLRLAREPSVREALASVARDRTQLEGEGDEGP
jgi:hypothetical protein